MLTPRTVRRHDGPMAAGRTRELVGRGDELTRLRAAADVAGAGAATIVVVSGEPGIGKSRLVAEVMAQLRDEGAIIATGRGVDLAGGALPYGVVAGLVRDLRAVVGTDRLVALLGPRTGAIGVLDPALAVDRTHEVDRHVVFEAVHYLVTELAREQLVCLVLEDLQWSDPSSLDLITFLATATTSGRLVVLATTRPEGGQRLARLVDLGELLSLRPLSERAARELAIASLPDSTDEDTLAQITTLGEGVPLYIEELVAVQTASSSGVPGALLLTFTARMAGLSELARRLLEAVAVAEGEVPAERLGRVLRVKRSAVTDALAEALAHGLVDASDSGQVRFHHELLRRAVTDAMTPLVRVQWHRRWALCLERINREGRSDPAALAALAHHWFHAGDADRAVPAAIAAGRAASGVGAATEAAVHWHRALSQWDRARDATDSTGLSHEAALSEGAAVMGTSGAYVELHEVLTAERVRAGATKYVLRLWLDLLLALLSTRMGDVRPQVVPRVQLDGVLDRLAEEPPGPLTRPVLFWLWWEAHDADERLVERFLEVLDAHPDPATAPRDASAFRSQRAQFALVHGDGEAALRIVRENLADVDLHPVERPISEALEVRLLYLLGLFAECVDIGERTLQGLGDPATAGVTWAGVADNLACAHGMTGNAGRAEELLSTILRSGDPLIHVSTTCNLVSLLATQGRLTEAEELLDSILEQQLPGPGMTGYRFGRISQVPACQARVAAARGDVGAARDLLRPLLADPSLTTDSEFLWKAVLDAGRLFQEPPVLEPLDERRGWAALVEEAAGRVHRYGALGSVWPTDVTVHLDRALDRDSAEQWTSLIAGWESLGAPQEAALGRLRLAERLARDGDRDQAAAEMSRALATAEELGAVPLVEQIRAAARRHRVRVEGVGPAGDGSFGLTGRELEVLALLADGRRNDQIATLLFMSPKTASVHVSHIIAKLGVANRTEAAAYAHRHGLAEG